jgi:hypothetical protein
MALTDGIIGCWSPSLGASGYRLLDRSGRGNHGVLTNMDAGTDWVGTSAGLALDYDGSNDHVRMSRSLQFLGDKMSVSVWVTFRTVGNAVIVNQGSTTNQFLLLHQAGWRVRGSSSTEYIFGTTATANRIIHVAFVANGTSVTGYLDGVPQSAGTISAISANLDTNLEFGSYVPFGGGFYLNGFLGEIAIYSRPLTAAEIRDLYRRGNGAIGRELTGQTRRRSYGFVAATGARRRRILTGMV